MKKIGITGSIGSGKSTVSKIFSALGVPIYDADSKAKILMVSNETLVAQIKELFGVNAYLPQGELNRKFIAGIAFQQKDKLLHLNALVHPAVFKDFDEWCLKQESLYVIKEAALMFESNSHKQLDEVIVVTAPETMRLQRVMKRDGITQEAVEARMKNQFSETEKLSRGQYEIKNNETELLIPQILALHHRFISV